MPYPVAVLTGDLIGSSGVAPDVLNKAMQALSEAAHDIAGWYPHGDTRFTRFRGDGWQIVVTEPWLALRAAVFLAARLRATGLPVASRIAIGIDAADNLGTTSLADAHGTAFELSGRALDKLGRAKIMQIQGEALSTKDQIIVELLAARLRRWTREQAEAMALMLHPDNPTLSDAALQIGISAQAVGYRQSGADGPAVKKALRDWEDEMEPIYINAQHGAAT
jgi:hypothetical protein